MAETQVAPVPALATTKLLDPVLRFKLSAMMFLQYAIWGVWAPVMGLHLFGLGFGATAIGLVYMTMPIASIIAPFIGGQIADRWFPTQRFLAISQLVGGILLIWVAGLTGTTVVFVVMLLYTLLYAPTIALTNSMVFHHWPNEQFSRIRMWGSIGWIVIGWILALWLGLADGLVEFVSPALKGSLVTWRGTLSHKPAMVDCLYIAGILSFIYAAFCLALPHTPPSKNPGRPWAILDALALMRNRAFAVMTIVAFAVGIELNLYFIWTQSFINQEGGPFEGRAIAASMAPAGASPEVVGTFLPAASELVTQGDKNADDKLSRSELSALAASVPQAKTFLESKDRLLAQKGGLALDQKWVAPVLTVGQICEMVMMAFLPPILAAFGFRWTIALGIAAWALRDFILALGHPTGLVIGAVSLHGVGFALFCTAIFIFADAVASKDIKASAQGFIASVTFGLGMLVGALLSGPLTNAFDGDWHRMYLVPAVLCAVCCVVFLIGFRDTRETAK